MLDYLERLRAKPEHIRRRIASGTAVGVTAVVALAWMAVITTNGTLAFTPPALPNDPALHSAVAQTTSSFSNLLGAAAAYQSGTPAPSGIQIETTASSTLAPSAPTTIPF